MSFFELQLGPRWRWSFAGWCQIISCTSEAFPEAASLRRAFSLPCQSNKMVSNRGDTRRTHSALSYYSLMHYELSWLFSVVLDLLVSCAKTGNRNGCTMKEIWQICSSCCRSTNHVEHDGLVACWLPLQDRNVFCVHSSSLLDKASSLEKKDKNSWCAPNLGIVSFSDISATSSLKSWQKGFHTQIGLLVNMRQICTTITIKNLYHSLPAFSIWVRAASDTLSKLKICLAVGQYDRGDQESHQEDCKKSVTCLQDSKDDSVLHENNGSKKRKLETQSTLGEAAREKIQKELASGSWKLPASLDDYISQLTQLEDYISQSS